MKAKKVFCLKFLWAIPFSFLSIQVNAQIIPDTTMPNNSIVTPNNNTFIINGGTTAGSNLFHSFQEFSISTGSEVLFNNTSNIQNIFSRVTGGKVSNIDGMIRANGTANLFFINPSGIIFGLNGRLNIGGSFIGSTANSIVFNDGFNFSVDNTQVPPLLSINTPIGLELRQNSGAILVQGNGHSFTARNPYTGPIARNENTEGLSVKSGQTLALIGGNINLEGGSVIAERGQIELGAVKDGLVNFNFNLKNWIFNYKDIQEFQDIKLSQQASIDASGGGSIQIVGRRVTLTGGSVALIQNQGKQSFGNLSVNASELLEVTGTNLNGTFLSSIVLEEGQNGQVSLSTGRLLVSQGAHIAARTFGTEATGDLSINASESVEIGGFSSIQPSVNSYVVTWTFGSGKAGDVSLSTRRLVVHDGGSLSTPSNGTTGQAGNLTVNASESVTVSGIIPETLQPASIGSATGSRGNAGNLTINTSKLQVRDGGTITTSTLAQGSAGSITINASDSVEVSGTAAGGLFSRIVSAGIIQSEAFRRRFGLPDAPSGNSGIITINTPRLTIADGARVSAANQGTGIAGNLNINAGSILLLDSAGGINAATASGEGGNINITTDFLQLRRASQISTQAGGTGNGGNLNINANTFAILEDSEVNANAFQGAGGNIRINSQGLFASPDSQITASSQLGVSGTININSPEVNTATALVELPQNLVDPTQQVVAACASRKGNTFTITGRGGLIENPTLPQSSEDIWQDWTYYNIPETNSTRIKRQITEEQHPQLVEATSWRLENGKVELIGVIASNQSNYRENPQSICK